MVKIGRSYFGKVDASSESVDIGTLDRRFFHNSIYEQMGDSEAPCVIVGLKGAGKTALGRILAKEFGGHSWFRDEVNAETRFDATIKIPRSGLSMHSIKLFLLEQFLSHLVNEDLVQRDKLTRLKDFVTDKGKNLLKATKVDVHGLQFDFAKLFATENSSNVAAAIERIVSEIDESLPKKDFLIILDDVDSYFVDLEKHPRFIEALCRAVGSLNQTVSPKITCVLLLKQGVWRALYERQEEYDKVKDNVEFLTWSLPEIEGVLAKSVADKHDLSLEDHAEAGGLIEILKKEFSGDDAEIQECMRRVFALCANGPRDAIDLCNKAKYHVKDKKIALSDILSPEVLSRYSEEKLKGINQDFGHLYPFLPEFVQNLFQGFKPEFSGQELSNELESGILNRLSQATQSYGNENWCKDGTASSIVKILYDVGLIGISRSGRLPVFAIEDPTPDVSTLCASELIVHEAYRSALGLSATN